MSRPDAHAPFHARVVRREVAVVLVHRCVSRDECDLPDLVPGWAAARSRYHWVFTYAGFGVCSCWMCHWHTAPEQRRVAVRTELRAVARSWNSGDDEAVFEA